MHVIELLNFGLLNKPGFNAMNRVDLFRQFLEIFEWQDFTTLSARENLLAQYKEYISMPHENLEAYFKLKEAIITITNKNIFNELLAHSSLLIRNKIMEVKKYKEWFPVADEYE